MDALCQPERSVIQIILYAALMVGLDIAVGTAGSQLTIYLQRFEDKFLNYSREMVAERCMEIDFALTENKQALDQIRKANDGIDWSGGLHGICVQFFSIISNVIKIVGVVTILAVSAPWLLLIIGVLLAVSSILNAKKNKIEVKWFSELSKVDRVYYYINYEQEDIRFAKDIRLYGAAGTLIAKAAEQIKRTISYDVDKEKELYPLNILDVTVTALRDFGTYLYLGILAILGSITIGQFSQLTAAGGTVNQAVQGVIFNIQDIVKRCSYAYETVKLMEYPPYLQKGTRKVENLKNPHEIEFRNVSFSYPNTGVQVLKNVSIKIKAGERLSVVGLNGAGKTTFIKLLCRLYDTDEGEILLDGVNIRDYDYDEYMKLFSVVFQDFRLLAFSVQEHSAAWKGHHDVPAVREGRRAAFRRRTAETRDRKGALQERPGGYTRRAYRGARPGGGVRDILPVQRACRRQNGGVHLAQAVQLQVLRPYRGILRLHDQGARHTRRACTQTRRYLRRDVRGSGAVLRLKNSAPCVKARC